MMCLVRLKNINILLLAVLLLWSCMCAVCGATEKTYTITESQLTQLEANLTELKEQNKTLQEQLQISKEQVQNLKTQSIQLQTQVQTLNQSLANANQLLTQYENNNNNDYAIGLGISKNGIAVTADIENKWIAIDEKNIMVGYKFKF
jgi:septal ring factor EnvC (AmiA/AmiB activator)